MAAKIRTRIKIYRTREEQKTDKLLFPLKTCSVNCYVIVANKAMLKRQHSDLLPSYLSRHKKITSALLRYRENSIMTNI